MFQVKTKRTIKPPAGTSRVSLRDATSAARVVYRDGTTGRLVVLGRGESIRVRDRASVKGPIKERRDSALRSSRTESKKR
jgi:hypothetical protein